MPKIKRINRLNPCLKTSLSLHDYVMEAVRDISKGENMTVSAWLQEQILLTDAFKQWAKDNLS